MSFQSVRELTKARYLLVDPLQDRGVVVEGAQLEILAGDIGAEGVAGGDEPAPRPQDAQHLADRQGEVAHVVQGVGRHHQVENAVAEGKEAGAAAEPASLG
jgi:hypothetical protein